MKTFEKIYRKLPLRLQGLAISCYGLIWLNERRGGVFKQTYKECIAKEHFSFNEWNEFNNKSLVDILLHAFREVPFYKDLYTQIGLTEADLKSFTVDDLWKLPFVDKETYRTYGTNTMLSLNRSKKGRFMLSSGSTGTPTKTWYSKKMHQKYFAIYSARVLRWAGISEKTPRGTFGPRRIVADPHSTGPFYRYNFAERQTYFSAFHLSSVNCQNYVSGMIKNNVRFMTGYCSSNFILARFIEENNLKAPKLEAVVTSSEKLTTEMRETFRRVYNCETFDSYNGVEACNLISECEHHRLHIVHDVGYTEILNDQGKNCLPGETGHVVCTGFLNFDQPLIRYKMGDLVKLSSDQICPCGRNLPVVDQIVGRDLDVVITADGREMVSFYRIFAESSSILRGQVIQNSVLDFDVNLEVIRPLSSTESEHLIEKFKSQLGTNTVIRLNFMEKIQVEKSGKFKSVISKVKRKSLLK